MAKILVVDDCQDIADVTKILLECAGYESIVAYDGQAGLDKVYQENPDLVIVDLVLPKVDGYKFCATLKADEKYKNIPVIIFTARTQDLERIVGETAGADAHIIKPYDAQILLAKIQELLTKRQAGN
jgi:DNA-binding response OmpR family regulator